MSPHMFSALRQVITITETELLGAGFGTGFANAADAGGGIAFRFFGAYVGSAQLTVANVMRDCQLPGIAPQIGAGGRFITQPFPGERTRVGPKE